MMKLPLIPSLRKKLPVGNHCTTIKQSQPSPSSLRSPVSLLPLPFSHSTFRPSTFLGIITKFSVLYNVLLECLQYSRKRKQMRWLNKCEQPIHKMRPCKIPVHNSTKFRSLQSKSAKIWQQWLLQLSIKQMLTNHLS